VQHLTNAAVRDRLVLVSGPGRLSIHLASGRRHAAKEQAPEREDPELVDHHLNLSKDPALSPPLLV
jgi:hypothetical protein